MKYPGQFAHIKRLVKKYRFENKASDYLKLYFAKNKNFGSKDRRFYKNSFFSYLRLSAFLNPSVSLEEKLVLSMSLCNLAPSPELLKDIINDKFLLSSEELQLSGEKLLDVLEEKNLLWTSQMFPSSSEISKKIDTKAFYNQLFQSPGIHLRIRKQEDKIKKELSDKGIPIQTEKDGHIICKSNARFQDFKAYKFGSFEIQDINSSKTLNDLNIKKDELWWDACAGAGGKSLLFKDRFPQAKLYASDLRPSSLSELERRAKRNQVQIESVTRIDLLEGELPLEWPQEFDGIIIDAPCTGSGTWIRNPEAFSRPVSLVEIEDFAAMQREIIEASGSKLKTGGKMQYITCSIFSKENEDLITDFAAKNHYQIEKMEYMQEAEIPSSTLFVATLEKK